jgi:hypothetical protein
MIGLSFRSGKASPGMPSRRAILAAATIAAPDPLSRRLRAAPSRKARLTLSWVTDGSNAFAFVARSGSYWTEAGLDVEITRGYIGLALYGIVARLELRVKKSWLGRPAVSGHRVPLNIARSTSMEATL